MRGWDLNVLEAVAAHRTWWATDLSRAVMAVGDTKVVYLTALLLCALFGWGFRAWRPAAAAPLSAIVAVVVTEIAKQLIDRPRPPHALALVTAAGSAMPSSIGAMTAAAATPVILAGLRMANRTGQVLAGALAAATLMIGVSMVYLGAHWLSDVLVGWALGAAIGTLVFRLIAGRPRGRSAAAR